jgi:para-nitrobenzyl esterase
LVAKKFKPTCPQPSNPFTTNLTYDEDCLTLNVWTPLPAPRQAPVMLFLHGGAFAVGAGGDAMYDGTSLAEHGVIVVTAN